VADPAAEQSEPTIDRVLAPQEAQHGATTHAELPQLRADGLALGIDHQASAQVADPLRLEPEGQVNPGQVVKQGWVEELLLRGRAAQLERFIEASLGDAEAEPEKGAIAWVGGIEPVRGSEVIEGSGEVLGL